MGKGGKQGLKSSRIFPKVALMLIGTYQHNMDVKGRVAIPARFREDLGDLFYVTKGLDGCLFVLAEGEWKRLQEKMKEMPIAKSVALQRFFFSGAAEVEPDKQGRILIPQHLRDYAGLGKDVTVTGVSSRAEIWDSEKWTNFTQNQTQENILEAMELLGF